MDENQPPVWNAVIAFALVAVAILAGGFLLLASRPEPVQIVVNPPGPTGIPSPSPTPAPIQVYVTGAVNTPQTTLSLVHNSRVQDAIDAAGGITNQADMDGVNPAAIVRDGDHVHVPAYGEAAALPTAGGGGLVYINTATLEEITTLPGVGPVIGERIIAYREQNGPFTSIDALLNVNGIGEATLENIRESVSLE